MSNKSSPPTRSSRTSPSAVRRRPRTTAAADTVPADKAVVPTTTKERVRHYLPVVGVPTLVVVLAIIALCLGTILLTGGRLAALPASIAETWFILHAVPVTYDGVTLGSMPLLPAIGVVAFIAWRVRAATRDRVSILDLYVIFGLVVLIPFTLSAIAWFMVMDASSVFPVEPPAVHKALFIPVFVHLLGLIVGMSERLWRALFNRLEAPVAVVDGVRAATRLFIALCAAGGVVFLVLVALGHSRISELMDSFTLMGAGGAAGLTLLSVLYFPNAAVHTLAVLCGAPFEIAKGAVSLFDATVVPLPPLPLFGAIPAAAPVWAPVLMLIPAAVLITMVIRHPLKGVEVLIGSVCVAVFAANAALMAGGQLGAYGWVGAVPWFFALVALGWVAVIAGTAWAVATMRGSRKGNDALEEPAEEADAEAEEEAEEADAEAEDGSDEDTDGDTAETGDGDDASDEETETDQKD